MSKNSINWKKTSLYLLVISSLLFLGACAGVTYQSEEEKRKIASEDPYSTGDKVSWSATDEDEEEDAAYDEEDSYYEYKMDRERQQW